MKKLLLIITLIIITAGLLFFYHVRHQASHQTYFKTEHPVTKTIKHVIATSGILELKDVMHIGSIQAGMVQDIFVKENQHVKKGQLIAIIDTAKNNTEVEANQHCLERAQHELNYQKAYFERQKALYDAKQLAKDSYEKTKKEYEKAIDDVNIAKAWLRKSTLEYESTKIKSPEDGIVIAIYATKGMVANDISNIVLFDLAQDITKMQATLDIDESEIGHVKVGQRVVLIPNCYPDMHLTGTINNVSFTPKGSNGTASDGVRNYKAIVDIDNQALLLRPSMIVNANIMVNKVQQALGVNGMAFTVTTEALDKIAQKQHLAIKAIDAKQRHALKRANPTTRFVWTFEGNTFVQKAITIGLTDNMFWQVLSGLNANDNVIVDTQEPNEMDAFYQQWFKGAL